MEPIDTKDIKDAVAKKYGFDDWDSLLLSDHHIDSYINEVISEVAKQVAERQKTLCWESQHSVIRKEMCKDSMMNCDSPEIK